MIPEIFAVAEFMAAQLGDCSADMDNTFLTLRVRISIAGWHSALDANAFTRVENSHSLSECVLMMMPYTENIFILVIR